MPEPSPTRGTRPTPAGPTDAGSARASTALNDPGRSTNARPPIIDGSFTDTELDAGRLAGQVTSVPTDDDAPTYRRRRKARNVMFWAALGWLALIVFVAITADWLPLTSPNAVNISDKLTPPFYDPAYPLGTDGLGRDLLARLAFGARVSLTISVAAVTIGLIVGGLIGMTAGFYRGRIESATMAVVNVILAFPGLVLLLGLVAVVGQSLPAITAVVGVLSIPVYARVARATTLAVSQREYVLAARAMGATNRRILFREIFPNVILPVMAFGLIALGLIIVLEGSLAFLGLSVQPPAATWGSTIAEGKRHLQDAPHVALMPSLAMFLTVLSINFVGDSLRSRFDVKESSL